LNRVRKVCGTCGSERVTIDAWASWDVDKQDWVLDDIFDNEYCHDCEGETRIETEEIE
jgi:hypothetical protein